MSAQVTLRMHAERPMTVNGVVQSITIKLEDGSTMRVDILADRLRVRDDGLHYLAVEPCAANMVDLVRRK